MSTVRRRPKGTPRRTRKEDPDIIAVLDQISVLTPKEREIRAVLQQLLREEQLELEDGADLDQLVIRLAEAMGDIRGVDRKAAFISDWLLQQDDVVDLYVDDEGLARVIASR